MVKKPSNGKLPILKFFTSPSQKQTTIATQKGKTHMTHMLVRDNYGYLRIKVGAVPIDSIIVIRFGLPTFLP